jgi:HD-GYP domain-containing protein (c-di-GMP phosphodiesterase class II)
VQPKRLKIETANLQPGMYVAQLDRPWLETPFLFKGFEIRHATELQQLRQFCKYVYVDISQGSLPEREVLGARGKEAQYASVLAEPATRREHAPPAGLARRLVDVLARFDRNGVITQFLPASRYRNAVPTHQEAPRAAAAYDNAARILNAMLEQFPQVKKLDAAGLQQAVNPLVDSILRNQDAMAWLVSLRKRDMNSPLRQIGSAVWAAILGRHLGFERGAVEALAMGGLLLDLGNARIPQSIILKQGPLEEVEQKIIRKHVALGLEMLRTAPGLNADVVAMLQHHHERNDGSGYPKGLSGADIPVFGRIAGLVDCFDAMTTKRPYAPAKSAYDAVREINSLSGTLFQKELVEQFVQAVGMFPTGSLVELNTGEIAVVTGQNRVQRLRPHAQSAHQPGQDAAAGPEAAGSAQCTIQTGRG